MGPCWLCGSLSPPAAGRTGRRRRQVHGTSHDGQPRSSLQRVLSAEQGTLKGVLPYPPCAQLHLCSGPFCSRGTGHLHSLIFAVTVLSGSHRHWGRSQYQGVVDAERASGSWSRQSSWNLAAGGTLVEHSTPVTASQGSLAMSGDSFGCRCWAEKGAGVR